MTDKRFHGVYAAVLSPRDEDGTLDLASLRSLVAFLKEHGIRRYAVNGATGEFCLATPEDLRDSLQAVRDEGGPGTEILCGVGGAGLAQTEALVRVAEEAEVQGLLLPMPYFFPYSQGDLAAFSTAVAASTHLPILLYNLPQFTSGLDAETVSHLIGQVPNIVGTKDSSGSLSIISTLTEQQPKASRIMGNDGALATALRGGLCDGVVSGVACVLPELISAFFSSTPGTPEFQAQSELLDTFIEQLNAFPTPWGLKWAAEARNIFVPHFSLPVSHERAQQATGFQSWLQDWWPKALATLAYASTHA